MSATPERGGGAVAAKRTSGFGEASRSWRVYGCCGLRITSSAGPRSTTTPPFSTMISSLKCRAVARSCVMYSTPRFDSRCRSASRLSTPRRIDTSSIETGSSAISRDGPRGERAGDRDALALTARELVRPPLDQRRRRVAPARAAGAPRPSTSSLGTTLWSRSGRSRWCRMVWYGFSDANGSWNTIRTCCRYARSARPPRGIGLAVEQDRAARRGLELGEDLGDRRLAAADSGRRARSCGPSVSVKLTSSSASSSPAPAHAVLACETLLVNSSVVIARPRWPRPRRSAAAQEAAAVAGQARERAQQPLRVVVLRLAVDVLGRCRARRSGPRA